MNTFLNIGLLMVKHRLFVLWVDDCIHVHKRHFECLVSPLSEETDHSLARPQRDDEIFWSLMNMLQTHPELFDIAQTNT